MVDLFKILGSQILLLFRILYFCYVQFDNLAELGPYFKMEILQYSLNPV